MKMNNIRKIALTLALVTIIASLFSISVFAENNPFVAWSLSDAKTELKNETEGIKYHRYNTGISVDAEPSITYVYANGVNYDDSYYGYEAAICQNPDYKDAVWVDGYDGYDIFVTDKGENDLKAFLSGDVGSFWLSDGYTDRTHIEKETLNAFDKALHDGVNTATFEVKDLAPGGKIAVYKILAMDKSKTFTYVYGAIYQLDTDEYWYVNYYELGNEYFDSYGEFSYRRGSVTMTKIEDAEAVSGMIADMDYFYSEYVYEDDGSIVEEDDTVLVILLLFWIVYIACFVLPPIPLAIIGFILPFIKKLGKPRYWFIFMAFALLWLIAALPIGVLMTVVIFMLI